MSIYSYDEFPRYYSDAYDEDPDDDNDDGPSAFELVGIILVDTGEDEEDE